MNKVEIQDIYLQKIAMVTQVPLEYVLKLRDMGLLHDRAVRDCLIKHDYLKLKRSKKYKAGQIVGILSNVYNVEQRKVHYVIRAKTPKVYYCSVCGSVLAQSECSTATRICNECLIKQVKI